MWFCNIGFNCGEAANIATTGWLTVAKEAAVRRASINCPPMVSHFQLLYDLALSSCSRFVSLELVIISCNLEALFSESFLHCLSHGCFFSF